MPFKIVNGERVEITDPAELQQMADDAASAASERGRLDALAAIAALEATITPRRVRDALLSDAGKTWLANVETQIAAERAKL